MTAAGERRADDPLGPLGDIYRPGEWRSASTISIAGHRQILVWPFVLRLDDGEATRGGGRDRIEAGVSATIDALERSCRGGGDRDAPVWEEIRDLLDHARQPHSTLPGAGDVWEALQNSAQTYGEFVYFYDFLQKSLFRTGDGSVRPPFRVWRRTDLRALEVVLDHWTGMRRHEIRIERFNLYVFDVGAAVAAIELDFTGDLDRKVGEDPTGKPIWGRERATFADVQLAVDQVRRAYTPYFSLPLKPVIPGNHPKPQGIPISVAWHKNSGGLLYDAALDSERAQRPRAVGAQEHGPPWTPDSLEAALDRLGLPICPTQPPRGGDTLRRRCSPLADHWRQALRPLVFAGYHPDVDRKAEEAPPVAVWRHVLDERIPVMSFVSLTGAAARCAGIANDRESGPREDLRLVNRGDWIRLCSADSPDDDPLPYAPHFVAEFEKEHCYDRFFPSDDTSSATRYMFAGYHFSVVGAGDYFDGLIAHHFRRHYFQMALLANMELAALLATSSRITEAVARLEQSSTPDERAVARIEFRMELAAIQEDFLRFVHRFRFTDVSNQIQPSELYRMWRKSMRIDGLYEDVKDELAAAVGFAMTMEQAETGRDAARLAAVATVGLPLALAFSFMPIFSEVIKNSDPWAPANVEVATKASMPNVPTPAFDWFHSAGWAGLPTLVALAVATFAAAGLLHVVTGHPDKPGPRPSLRTFLLNFGIASVLAAAILLFVVLSTRH